MPIMTGGYAGVPTTDGNNARGTLCSPWPALTYALRSSITLRSKQNAGKKKRIRSDVYDQSSISESGGRQSEQIRVRFEGTILCSA